MSRLPWSFWLGSSTSPLAMTMSNLSAGSAGLKPRGAGWAAAWATSVGAWAPAPGVCPASVTPAAAAVVERRKFRRVTSMPDLLARGAAHGRRLAREPEALPRVRDRSALHLQDGHVTVRVVADVEVLAVRAEDDPLGQAAHLDLADLRYLLTIDLEYDDLARLVRKPGVLRHAGAAVEEDRNCDLARRADREALGRVADNDAVDDARWSRLEVDNTHGVHVAVGGARVTVVGRESDLAVRRDVDVVRPEPRGHVVLGVGDLLTVDLQHGDFVARELDRERALAVGRDGNSRDHLAHRHRVDQLHLLALDREDADRVVGAVRDERQIASAVDREARGLLADLHGRDVRRWICGEVDDVELGVGRGLPGAAVLHPGHRVGDEPELAVRRDLEVRRRAEDRVHQGKAREDPRRLSVRDVDDRDRVLSRREEERLARVVPGHFLVVADDHELRVGRERSQRESHHEQERQLEAHVVLRWVCGLRRAAASRAAALRDAKRSRGSRQP